MKGRWIEEEGEREGQVKGGRGRKKVKRWAKTVLRQIERGAR